MFCNVLQCVAVCCNVLQKERIATTICTHTKEKEKVFVVCCSVSQCVAMCYNVLQCVVEGENSHTNLHARKREKKKSFWGVAVCCSLLQCIAMCCSVLQCVAVCCSALQCVAVCCSVLQKTPICTHATEKKRSVFLLKQPGCNNTKNRRNRR